MSQPETTQKPSPPQDSHETAAGPTSVPSSIQDKKAPASLSQPTADSKLAPEDEEDPKITWQMVLAFLAINSQYTAYVMTLLIPSTTLQYIIRDLPPDNNYPWITISWTLCAAVIVSISGRLSDIFGRRYFLITGAFISWMGTFVGATGQSVNQMIASGVIFGIGSGFQEMAFACVQEFIPNKWRIYGIALFDVLASVAWVCPLVAYSFIKHTAAGWRGAYWYMCGFHGFFFFFLILTYFPPEFKTKHKADGKTKWELIKEIDYVGVFLFTAAGILFIFGISSGGRLYEWTSPTILCTLIIGGLLFIALGFWEAYADLKYPLMPPRLFKRVRRITMVLIVCFAGGMLYYSMNVLWPRQTSLFWASTDPIQQGLYAQCIPLGTLLSALVVVFICGMVGHERWQLVGFMIVETTLIGSMASVGLDNRVQGIITIILLSCSVTPPQLLSFTMLSLGIKDQDDIGIAVGMASTFRLLGGSIATAVYTTVINNTFDNKISGEITNAVSGLDVPSDMFTALVAAAKLNTAAAYSAIPNASVEVIAAVRVAVKQTYVLAFSKTYLVAILFGGIAIIAAFFTKDIDKAMKNNSRAVILENEKEKSEA